MGHIRVLSEEIGGRGSCTPAARSASEYIYQELGKLGVPKVEYEPFQGYPSTYRPYVWAFGSALLGSLLGLLLGWRWALAVGACLNLAGVWAMFAETQFKPHWGRWLSKQVPTRNLTGTIPPSGPSRHKVVLCAHYDTHRTPVFYSSASWQRLFSVLVSGAFLSMLVGFVFFGIGGILDWTGMRWIGILLVLFQAFVFVMVTSADFTPFSPGANDNASGVGVVLSLVKHLQAEPLAGTEVHLVFTDCEETGAHGMLAYLDQNMNQLGKETVYIVLDEVGTGMVKYITDDGLVIKHKTHPRALHLERQAAAVLAGGALEMSGTAYNDALPATLRGCTAVTVCSESPDQAVTGSHWHQMSDRLEFINLASLHDAHEFTWHILQAIDADFD